MTLSKFRSELDKLLPSPISRPFLCDGSPLKCRIFIVGTNSAREVEKPFWSYWSDSYGFKKARDIVLQLIIDDGVPSRGHRTNIFNTTFKVTGVAIAKHPDYGHLCVIDYAGGFKDK